MKHKTISLIIPCLNEVAAIPVVMARLEIAQKQLEDKGWSLETLVVDDGSTDGTAEALNAYPQLVKSITHGQNLGYGQALKSGFTQAKGQLIAMMDMDATYDPVDIIVLLDHMETENLDVVFGNRMLPQSDFTAWRRFGNNLFGFLFKHFLNLPHTDVCSGLRLFKRSFVPAILELPYRGFNLSIAMSALFLCRTSKCQQIPITYSARVGESKLLSWVEGWTHLYVIVLQWSRSRKSY
jgi:glycosyltransferase involved in cell wall biosynthesis